MHGLQTVLNRVWLHHALHQDDISLPSQLFIEHMLADCQQLAKHPSQFCTLT